MQEYPEVAELAKRGELRTFARNEQLIYEGEKSRFVYILITGEVKVFTKTRRVGSWSTTYCAPESYLGSFPRRKSTLRIRTSHYRSALPTG
jgi:CRP-like cAMP-binding protein